MKDLKQIYSQLYLKPFYGVQVLYSVEILFKYENHTRSKLWNNAYKILLFVDSASMFCCVMSEILK